MVGKNSIIEAKNINYNMYETTSGCTSNHNLIHDSTTRWKTNCPKINIFEQLFRQHYFTIQHEETKIDIPKSKLQFKLKTEKKIHTYLCKAPPARPVERVRTDSRARDTICTPPAAPSDWAPP